MPRISPGIPGVLLYILLLTSSGEVLRSQTAPKDGKVFDSVDVSLGFVRVTVPVGSPRPVPGDFEVKWKGKFQRVVDVIGGPDGSAEIGIAIDQSASMGGSFEVMRSEVLDFVERGIANDDNLFVVTFADKLRTVATGRAAALRELRALSASPATD